MSLTSKDYEVLLKIIEAVVHSFPDRTSTFLAICEQLDKLIGISSAIIRRLMPHFSQAPHNLNLAQAIAKDHGYGVVAIARDGVWGTAAG